MPSPRLTHSYALVMKLRATSVSTTMKQKLRSVNGLMMSVLLRLIICDGSNQVWYRCLLACKYIHSVLLFIQLRQIVHKALLYLLCYLFLYTACHRCCYCYQLFKAKQYNTDCCQAFITYCRYVCICYSKAA